MRSRTRRLEVTEELAGLFRRANEEAELLGGALTASPLKVLPVLRQLSYFRLKRAAAVVARMRETFGRLADLLGYEGGAAGPLRRVFPHWVILACSHWEPRLEAAAGERREARAVVRIEVGERGGEAEEEPGLGLNFLGHRSFLAGRYIELNGFDIPKKCVVVCCPHQQ